MSRQGCRNISYTDRIRIEALFRAGHRPAEIAAGVGFSVSAIYRELKRGRYDRLDSELFTYVSYSADIAQKDYDYKASNKGPVLKLGNDYAFVDYVERKIVMEHYSPAAVIAELASLGNPFRTHICARTLYNYIESNFFLHLSNEDLPRKPLSKRSHRKVHPRIIKPLARSIEDRTESIDQRESFGHWEMDTVVGKAKGKGQALLVLTERQTRQEIIRKLGSKTQFEVLRALDRIERKYRKDFPKIFQTITVDNGCEFLNPELLERSCLYKGKTRTTVYYCHPYSSWERGSNENQNAMIRRFIPKGSPIENYSEKQIQEIEDWLNRYPRKLLHWECSQNLFSKFVQSI